MSEHLRWIWLIALLLASVPAVGQVPGASETSPSTQTSKLGAITGRVVNESGQPLPNASVVVTPIGPARRGYPTITNREGKFEVTGLEPLTYQVAAYLSPYTALPRDPDSTQPTNYHVGDSVTLVLIKGGVITGTVTTQLGEPVVRVFVRAQMIRGSNGQRLRAGGFMAERFTDDRGIYRLYGLPSGTYVVSAGGFGNRFAQVDPYDRDVPTYAPSSPRDTAAEVSVRAGEETEGVDIRYRGEPGHVVSGTVSGPQGGPETPGYSVVLSSTADGTPQSYTGSPGGGFAFYGVDDGDYYVTARSLPGGLWALSSPKRIRVRGADVTGIELITSPLGSVAGRVVLEESKAPECTDKGRPQLTETLVSAWHKDDEAARAMPPFFWSLGAPMPADANGDFVLRNLAAGQYNFVARFAAKYWYLQSIAFAPAPPAGAKAVKPTDATRVWTNVKGGDQLTALTITLAQGAASVRGQLKLAEGEVRPARLYAYLVPVERERAEDVLRYFAAPIDPDGKIALNNIAPGRYWILAQPALDETVPPLTKLRLPDETETRMKLRRDAEAAKKEIELKPCQNVVDFQLNP